MSHRIREYPRAAFEMNAVALSRQARVADVASLLEARKGNKCREMGILALCARAPAAGGGRHRQGRRQAHVRGPGRRDQQTVDSRCRACLDGGTDAGARWRSFNEVAQPCGAAAFAAALRGRDRR
jgi:hypothetical protein